MNIYKISIDESDILGMSCISLVEDPAVQRQFLTFSEEGAGEKLLKLSKIDEDKHIITGVVAVADMPILRFNEELGYHYIVFEKDVIEKMIQRYFKNGYSNNVNIEHNGPMIKGMILFESYIKDSTRGINPVEFSDLTDGSWLVSYKVTDDALWEEIKEGNTLKGFSLEGYFQYGDKVKMSNETEVDDYDKWLEDILK